MSTETEEKNIRNIYYWDIRAGSEEDYKNGVPVPLEKLEEKLKSEIEGRKHYYSMSPKARRFGLWKNMGKSYNKQIKILRKLIQIKKKITRDKS